DHRSCNNLLIILTDGQIVWDDQAKDFDWTKTTALPEILRGAFEFEPGHVDFSRFRRDRLSLDDEGFLDHVASIAARLHGKSKDEIYGEHIRQHRKTMQLAWSAVMTLSVLLIIAVVLAFVARFTQKRAERQTRTAMARLLAVQAREAGTSNPPLG